MIAALWVQLGEIRLEQFYFWIVFFSLARRLFWASDIRRRASAEKRLFLNRRPAMTGDLFAACGELTRSSAAMA